METEARLPSGKLVSELKVKDLQRELQKRRLPAVGKKADLSARLAERLGLFLALNTMGKPKRWPFGVLVILGIQRKTTHFVYSRGHGPHYGRKFFPDLWTVRIHERTRNLNAQSRRSTTAIQSLKQGLHLTGKDNGAVRIQPAAEDRCGVALLNSGKGYVLCAILHYS
ncbi:unnamed protein product [Heligmosomoides polygyrus]|uniref:SAP domain-containing protein n=1 Tax=Heligmosomoides polygyrus TaxID=6339 RepID=A0A183GTZ2_HELPZ|nr:unnamed protein product [Heligmosomoides polygyrus]